MDNTSTKINSFKDLIAWQVSHKLAVEIYKATENFPKHQQFGLTNQLQRAAVSVASNIAEGFARKSSNDQAHFLYMALGSVNEIQSQLLIAKDLGYITKSDFKTLDQNSIQASKLVNGLIKSCKNR